MQYRNAYGAKMSASPGKTSGGFDGEYRWFNFGRAEASVKTGGCFSGSTAGRFTNVGF